MKSLLKSNAYIIAGVLLVVITFSSCEKKKWKKPTDVSFGFRLNSNSGNGLIKFSSGYFLLSRIDFSGDRNQGSSPVEFSKDYEPNSQIYFNPNVLSGSISFDIPQGTYTKIDMKVRTEEQQNNAPTLIIYGTYINTISDTIAVRFEFTSGESFEIQGVNSSGGTEILLMEDKPSSTSIIFNPKYWFDVVPQSMLESATIVLESNIQTMIINESDNDDIYQLVVGRIKDGNELIFN